MVYYSEPNVKLLFLDNLVTELDHKNNLIIDFYFRYSEIGPDSADFNTYLDDLKNELRQRIADLIKSRADEIIFTQSTTEGINFVANGLKWKSNDCILIRNSINEHFSNYLPWLKAATDFKLEMEVFPSNDTESTGTSLMIFARDSTGVMDPLLYIT